MEKETIKEKKSLSTYLITLAVGLFLVLGFFRVYSGKGIGGTRVVFKDSFSFKDTFVNVDDIMTMPRIAVATYHPAVKRQLEEMDIIDTDEEITRQTINEYNKVYNELLKKYK